jgi:hypothetical protein
MAISFQVNKNVIETASLTESVVKDFTDLPDESGTALYLSTDALMLGSDALTLG